MLLSSSGRAITYLRLSVTPSCPLRCTYCRPPGLPGRRGQPLLTSAEIELLVQVLASDYGLKKVRLTGGDPTSHPDLVEIISRISVIPGISELAMTTHGLTLARSAREYARAGLKRVNISLDTLNRQQFRRITGADAFERVLAGVFAARTAGFAAVRINTVVMRGENEDQLPRLLHFAARLGIEARFIEFMPMGPMADGWAERFVAEADMRANLDEYVAAWESLGRCGHSANRYRVRLRDGQTATIGFISAMSRPFCSDCSRLRIGSDGAVLPCLMDEPAGSLLPALRPQFSPSVFHEVLRAAVARKSYKHSRSGFVVMTSIGG